jgi:TRAP-type C4-dicarboxylate transport system substrate-binding protein
MLRPIFGAALGLAVLLQGGVQAQETMRAVGFTARNDQVLEQAGVWAREVNQRFANELRINYVGGPEVIGRFQQIEALINGVVDVVFAPANDYQDRLPVSGAFVLSRLSPSEERRSGFYDFMVEEHRKIGLRYLGRIQVSPFYLWTRTQPRRLEDLRGLRMRTGVLYDRLMREFGMVPVTINAPEVFTALESGVVDGFGWPVAGNLRRGWLDRIRYVIDLPFFGASNVVILMNQRRFDALPQAVQQRLIQFTAEFEPRMVEHFERFNAEEWRQIGDRVTRVRFSDEENRRFIDTAYELEWRALRERAPEQVDRIRQLSGN